MPLPELFDRRISLKSRRPEQPRLEIPRTRLEINLEILAAAIVIFLAIYLAAVWSSIPERIPTHFGFSGQPDSWGSKYSLLLLIGVAAVLYLTLTVLQRFPHIYNYAFALTDANRRQQYLLARQLMTAMKAELAGVFTFIIYRTIQVALGQADNLTAYFLPVFLVLIFGTIIVYFVRAYRAR
jgi:uncharacterized membrane protein